MPRTWKKRTPEFRQQALERMQEARDLGLLAKELSDKQLGRVKKVREPVPRETKLEAEIQQLKQSLANRLLEVDFFKGALQKVEARRRKSGDSGARTSTTRSGE